MTPKLLGCCTKCDKEVFDVVRRDEQRRPVAVSRPHDDAMRVQFILMGGSRMDLTFCEACAAQIVPENFQWFWRRVMLSWETESPGHPHQRAQLENGILALSHVTRWKDL